MSRTLILVNERERCLLKAQSAIAQGNRGVGVTALFLLPLVRGEGGLTRCSSV